MISLIADSGIAAAFHSLGDTGVRIWVPDVFKSIEITDEYAESVSERYIELYEHIVGERFEREATEGDIAQRIEENVSSWLKAFKSK